MLRDSSRAQLQAVEEKVRRAWVHQAGSEAAEKPPQQFWEATYYDFMDSLNKKRMDASQPSSSAAGTAWQHLPGGSVDQESMGLESLHASPTGVPRQATAGSWEYISALNVLEGGLTGTRYIFEGCVTSYSETPREVKRPQRGSPAKRQRQSEIQAEQVQHVIDVSLFDYTGPILASLWDNTCEEFLRQMQNASPKQIIRLKGLRVSQLAINTWNGQSLTNIHLVHSIQGFVGRPGTEVSLISKPEAEFMVAKLFVPPKHPIRCHHFASMQSKLIAPFRATFHGTFVDVGELDMSQQGQPKRYFSFVDDSSAWMKGCALGGSC